MATARSQSTVDSGAVPPGGGEAVGLQAIFNQLAARLGDSARAANVFGEPVERGGVTVIPVATARWGMGGGAQKRIDGLGAGGGATVTPTGYIEIRGGASRFRPLWDAKSVLAGAAILGALLAFALRRR
jgi:uncharacterized spore protein YtfJ